MNFIEARDIFEEKGDICDYIIAWKEHGESGAINYVKQITGCNDVIAKNLLKFYGKSEKNTSDNTDTAPSQQESSKPTVQCPYCKSTNTHKITTTAKVVNTALFGLFGTKRNKQWHCDGCGSEW